MSDSLEGAAYGYAAIEERKRNRANARLRAIVVTEELIALRAENERLRVLVKDGLRAVTESYKQAYLEFRNHDIIGDRRDRYVSEWRNRARAALKDAPQ